MPGYHQSPADAEQFSLELAPQSIAASTAANGAGVDMQGWDGVMFIFSYGVIDGTQDMKAQGDSTSAFSTAADITGAAITQRAATDDNHISILDVWRPTSRFVRAVVTNGAGATADFQSVVACRYRRTGRTPITQDASVLEVKKVAVN